MWYFVTEVFSFGDKPGAWLFRNGARGDLTVTKNFLGPAEIKRSQRTFWDSVVRNPTRLNQRGSVVQNQAFVLLSLAG